jgi:hypothetical protein
MGLDAVSEPEPVFTPPPPEPNGFFQVLILKILKILTLVKQLETLTAPF